MIYFLNLKNLLWIDLKNLLDNEWYNPIVREKWFLSGVLNLKWRKNYVGRVSNFHSLNCNRILLICGRWSGVYESIQDVLENITYLERKDHWVMWPPNKLCGPFFRVKSDALIVKCHAVNNRPFLNIRPMFHPIPCWSIIWQF